MKFIITSFLAFLLTACTGMNVMETSDPNIKLQQSKQMIQQGRPLMADRLIFQAIELYKKNNDSLGVAEGYFSYAALYREESIKSYKTIYDPTFQKSINSYQEAIVWFKKAKSEIGVAKTLASIGMIHGTRGNFEKTCSYLIESQNIYNTGKSNGAITKDPEIFAEGFSDFGTVIKQLLKQANCGV
jgi:hypothetical protein